MDRYDYFLFDWDGCLAKTLEVWLDAYRQAIVSRGIIPNDEEISHHFGDWELPKYFGVNDYDQCNLDAVAVARNNLKEVSLYDGTIQLLDSLRYKKKMALLSSASKDILFKGLEHNGIKDYFEVILSGEDVTRHKPHPEVIEKGLAALGGDKNKSLMIGDSRKDLEAARNAGVDSALIYPPSHKIFYDLEDLKSYNPTYVFSDLSELRSHLLAT